MSHGQWQDNQLSCLHQLRNTMKEHALKARVLGLGPGFAIVSCVILEQSTYAIFRLQIPYSKMVMIISSSLFHRVLVRLK